MGCESQPTNIWLGDIFHKILNLNCLCKGTFCCKFDNFLGGKVHQFFKNNWGVISPYLNASYVLASFSIVTTFNSYLFYNLFTNWYGILFGMTTKNITSENWKKKHTHTHTHWLGPSRPSATFWQIFELKKEEMEYTLTSSMFLGD